MAARQQIPYGIVDFKRIRDEGYYYVDKTAYIRKMEARDSFVFFVRPRRMGKSLFRTSRTSARSFTTTAFCRWPGGARA